LTEVDFLTDYFLEEGAFLAEGVFYLEADCILTEGFFALFFAVDGLLSFLTFAGEIFFTDCFSFGSSSSSYSSMSSS